MDAWKEFRFFIGIAILLWIVWFITGGTSRYEAKPYVERPQAPGEIEKKSGKLYPF